MPTEWYPTVVAATTKDLLIATAKGQGSGPNPKAIGKNSDGSPSYPYTPALTHGSLARLALSDLKSEPAGVHETSCRNECPARQY